MQISHIAHRTLHIAIFGCLLVGCIGTTESPVPVFSTAATDICDNVAENFTSRQTLAGLSGVSLLFYPWWVQDNLSPDQIDYSAWTHIAHFAATPDTSGNVVMGSTGASYPTSAIEAAHAAGRKIIITIGGAGTGQQFVSSTSSTNLTKFINNIVSTMTQYGYDGVDIDWEENFTEAPYVALIQGLRSELEKISPRPLLTTDVDVDLNPPVIVAKVVPYVDLINLMTYKNNKQTMYNAYANAGVPANKMTVGLAISADVSNYDNSVSQVSITIKFAKQMGMAGIMAWEASGLNTAKTDPILVPIRSYSAGQ